MAAVCRGSFALKIQSADGLPLVKNKRLLVLPIVKKRQYNLPMLFLLVENMLKKTETIPKVTGQRMLWKTDFNYRPNPARLSWLPKSFGTIK
ncbi:hypothetical protein [Mesoflavibacter zeaxanthinifaciens]|uniref:hypothetical protein n=1 Tax=Mesoflavibacter zeaxanthinifaciens TaxID=393060 RepID=UPI003A936E68